MVTIRSTQILARIEMYVLSMEVCPGAPISFLFNGSEHQNLIKESWLSWQLDVHALWWGPLPRSQQASRPAVFGNKLNGSPRAFTIQHYKWIWEPFNVTNTTWWHRRKTYLEKWLGRERSHKKNNCSSEDASKIFNILFRIEIFEYFAAPFYFIEKDTPRASVGSSGSNWIQLGGPHPPLCPAWMKSLSLLGGLEHFLLIFHFIYIYIMWEFHHPNWLIFFRGVGIPPTRSCFRHLPSWGGSNTATTWGFQRRKAWHAEKGR